MTPFEVILAGLLIAAGFFGLGWADDRFTSIGRWTGRFAVLVIVVASLVWQLWAPEWTGSPWLLAVILAYRIGRKVEPQPDRRRP